MRVAPDGGTSALYNTSRRSLLKQINRLEFQRVQQAASPRFGKLVPVRLCCGDDSTLVFGPNRPRFALSFILTITLLITFVVVV